MLVRVPRIATRSALALALVMSAAACGASSGPHDPSPPVGKPVLPDLSPSPSVDVQMRGQNGRWLIRFSSTLVNVGRGDFVLRAKRDANGRWQVDQEVLYSKSGAQLVATPARVIWGGDGHNHWHIARVATNRLVPLGRHGVATEEGLVDSKVGFCFYDYSIQLQEGPLKPRYVHQSCGKKNGDFIGMGLSSGWGDTYPSVLPGQTIDVTDVPDGRYRLITRADEPGWFHEVSTKNDMTWVDLEISTAGDARFAKILKVGPKPSR